MNREAGTAVSRRTRQTPAHGSSVRVARPSCPSESPPSESGSARVGQWSLRVVRPSQPSESSYEPVQVKSAIQVVRPSHPSGSAVEGGEFEDEAGQHPVAPPHLPPTKKIVVRFACTAMIRIF